MPPAGIENYQENRLAIEVDERRVEEDKRRVKEDEQRVKEKRQRVEEDGQTAWKMWERMQKIRQQYIFGVQSSLHFPRRP